MSFMNKMDIQIYFDGPQNVGTCNEIQQLLGLSIQSSFIPLRLFMEYIHVTISMKSRTYGPHTCILHTRIHIVLISHGFKCIAGNIYLEYFKERQTIVSVEYLNYFLQTTKTNNSIGISSICYSYLT